MATKVLDQDKALELLRRYRPLIESVKGGGGTMGFRFLCPFHTDTNPSFMFNISTGHGYCFSCKAKAYLPEILAAFEGISTAEAAKITESCYRRTTKTVAPRKIQTVDISLSQIQAWQSALATDIKLNSCIKRWGWTKEIVEKYMIGSSDGRMTFPLYEGDSLVGLKYYTPGASSNKYQNVAGSTQVCWPLENLEHDTVYLVEGEKDCITMISAGFNAVTFTTGASVVPKEYIRYFAGKTVYIIYDIDEAGRKGAVTAANSLSFASRKVYIVELPLDGIPKGDLTDAYMKDPENFAGFITHLVMHTDEYKSPEATSRVHVPPGVTRTYLEDVVKNKLFYRRVRVKGRVISNVHNETTVVPKDLIINCNRDFKEGVCQSCPCFYKQEGLSLHIRPEYPEIMSMVGNNIKVQRSSIQSMVGVAEGCPRFKVEQLSHQALFPIVLIPAIEADKKHHNYSLVEAWALDVPAKENEDYDIEAVVMADPETQKLVLLCYSMKEDTTSIDNFELTDDLVERLKVFQCTNLPSPKLNKS